MPLMYNDPSGLDAGPRWQIVPTEGASLSIGTMRILDLPADAGTRAQDDASTTG
jgi:hypothetical protein